MRVAAIKRWFGGPNLGTASKSFHVHSAKLFTRPRAVLGDIINPTTNSKTVTVQAMSHRNTQGMTAHRLPNNKGKLSICESPRKE